MGPEVLQAAAGRAALARWHETKVDALLLDPALPGIDGWETLRECARHFDFDRMTPWIQDVLHTAPAD